MRLTVARASVLWIGLVALILGAGGGCGGESNDEGDILPGEPPADAPQTQAEYYQRQMEGTQ